MALSKTIEVNNTGVNATYWVVQIIHFDLAAGTTWAQLSGYASSVAFQAGKTKLTDRGFSTTTPANFATQTGAQITETVQQFILTQPEFAGATEVA